MMTIKEVLKMVAELDVEEKKTEKVYPTYKRNGKILTRSYPNYIYTERYKELLEKIYEQKIFKCNECGEMCHYYELEAWGCNFDEEDGLLCSSCYEEAMGEDL